MQSTGQTSTQERSFRLMHGSAMMYVIQAPASHVPTAGASRPNRKHRSGPTPVKSGRHIRLETRTAAGRPGDVQRRAAPATEMRVMSDNTATSQVYCSRAVPSRSEEHTSELQSRLHLVCRLLLEKKKD